MSDSFDLQRFVDAQEPVYRQVVEELRRGRKTSHWMWITFTHAVQAWMAGHKKRQKERELENRNRRRSTGPRSEIPRCAPCCAKWGYQN